MEKPTEKQAMVLDYIISYLATNRYPPTIAEINKRFGWSSNNAAAGHLYGLRRKGFIAWRPGDARTIQVLDTASGGLSSSERPTGGPDVS